MTPSHAGTSLRWKSSNKKIATVTDEGVVEALKDGTATITVTSANGLKATCKVTVKLPAAKKVTLSKKGTVTLKVGKSVTLKATVTPKLASQTVTWSSSNKKVATVSSKGKVTAKKAGTATITAKTANGKKATVKIKVAASNDADIPDDTEELLPEEDVETDVMTGAADDPDTEAALLTGWQKIDGDWYYFDENGQTVTGWLEIIGNDVSVWYWLDEETGKLLTEDWKEIEGVWYYFDQDGRMATGWQVINGGWELFNDQGAWQESGDAV